ncbi:cytochrome P450 [Linderina pennispora]|uniref:Cytochrome P450 n=1 Tax=Linderina pennispora TaxID=61395 RepID=A0A1Y1WHI5_9FUNG|nr:cytochrome P450 [Linderina pennispora]ORX73031.1 cytochrome P450 [Linderina pennispora]
MITIDIIWSLFSTVLHIGYVNLLATAASLAIAYRVYYALYVSPLCNVPGPFLARITNKRSEFLGAIGYMGRFARNEPREYGDVYVYQPNAVAISHPVDVRTLASMRRRQLGPYFSMNYLAKAEPKIAQNGILSLKAKWETQLAASVDGRVEVNYYKDFLFATFDTIGALAFGREFNALKNNDRTMIDWIGDAVTYLGMTANFPLLANYPASLLLGRWERSYNSVIDYAKASVNMRRGYLSATSPENKPESLLMLLAGSETSSNTLMWTVHLLMLYPQHYQRAVDEVRTKFAADYLIGYSEGRLGLPFIEACIYESMRLMPVTGGLWPRVVPESGITLQGHYLPPGTEIYVNLSGANLNSAVWDRPLEFDPTRFLDNEEARRNMFTFSTGVRICPGRNLAWIEMLGILANVLKDYDIAFPEDYKLRGPNVLDENGNPKVLDSRHFFVSVPQNPERDCRLVLTKRV